MAKVILITSREIDTYVNDLEPLKYSEKYKELFQKNRGFKGFVDKIIGDEDLYEEYSELSDEEKKDVDIVAKYIRNDKSKKFMPGVYKFPTDAATVYLAHEYPFFEQGLEAKCYYLNGLFEMIDLDIAEQTGNEIDIFVHDKDFGWSRGILQTNQKERIYRVCNKCNLLFLRKYVAPSTVILFEHDRDDENYKKVLEIISKL